MRKATILALSLVFTLLASARGPAPESTEAWRQAYAESLLRPEGWLKLAGLWWLQPGDSPIGSSSNAKVILPSGAPDKVGTLTLTDGHVRLSIAPGAQVSVDGKQLTQPDADITSSLVGVGDITFRIIKRGNRTGVRVFDPHSAAMREYHGLHWYPVSEAWHFHAKYTPYAVPKELPITNVLGDTAPVPNPGYVTFEVDGKEFRLEAQGAGDGLFFNFHDLTSAKETDGAGRFLDAPAPKDGFVDLDFNRATNPPCGYTNFATCPLPPKANFLQVAVRAGEKKFH